MSQAHEKLYDDFKPISYDEWKLAAEKALKGAPFERKMLTNTYEGIVLKPIYRSDDVGVLAGTMPGSAPFIRSAKVSGYIDTSWLISQECDNFDVQLANATLRSELERGLQAIHLKLDSASMLCIDPDEADAASTGDKGISVCNTADMEELFAGIDFGRIPIRVHTGQSAVPFIALLKVAADNRGIKTGNIKGVIGADPMGMLAESGSCSASMDELYGHMAVSAVWACKNAPELRTVIVDTSCYHNAGANAVQEAAYAVAIAAEYIRELVKRGLSFSDTCSQIQFVFSIGANMFMEIAKLRAFRLLWSQICAAYGEDSCKCAPSMHVRTSRFTKTVYDPYVNLLRATTEAFAGVVAGVDSMHVGTLDEAVRRGDNFSRRLARNIQIVLQNECDLTHPIDPSGGSWYIENLTENIAREAWEEFRKIESAGGMLQSLKNGTAQSAVGAVFAKRQTNLAKRSNVMVGTNMYANLDEKPIEPGGAVDSIKIKQSTTSYKENRDSEKIAETLDKLHSGSISAFEAAFAGCTAGEIYRAMVKASGAESVTPLMIRRNAELFEDIRRTTESHAKKTGSSLRIFSANIGTIPQHKARADFARSFFEVGAFDVISNDGFMTAEEAANAAAMEKPDAVVICSADDIYAEVVPSLAKLLRQKLPQTTVFLAGLPPEDLQTVYKSAGVDGFIYLGADCGKILKELQKCKGII